MDAFDGLILQIVEEIIEEIDDTDIPSELDYGEEVRELAGDLVYEHTRDFNRALFIYADYAENHIDAYNIFSNINLNSHPKTIMSMIAYDIILETVYERLKKEG